MILAIQVHTLNAFKEKFVFFIWRIYHTFVSEFVATNVTLEGPLTRMAPVVILELAPRLKVLLTNITDESRKQNNLVSDILT